MDPVVAEDFVLIDTAFGSLSTNIDINGVAVPNPNFVDSASVTFSVVGSNVHATAAGVGSGAWATLTGDLTETQVIPWDGATPGIKTTGISRTADGTLAIGNGTQGDANGTLELAGITSSGAVTFTSAVGSGVHVDALTVQLSEAAASTWDWNFQDGGVQPGTGKHDWTAQFGYNVNNNTTKKPTESAIYIGMESNWEQTQGIASTSQSEFYIQQITPNVAGGGPAGGPMWNRVLMTTQNKLTGLVHLALSADEHDIQSNGSSFTFATFSDDQTSLNTALLNLNDGISAGYAKILWKLSGVNKTEITQISTGIYMHDYIVSRNVWNYISATGLFDVGCTLGIGGSADTGISRVSPNVLQIGITTGTPDASGQLGVAIVRNTGFTVANLPATAGAGKVEGATAYATNGLKPTETTGNGTGIPVFYSAAGPAGAGWYAYPGLALVAS
jgi:hypothetical protein